MKHIYLYKTNMEQESGLYIYYIQFDDRQAPRPMIMSVSTFNILVKELGANNSLDIIPVDLAHQSVASAFKQHMNNKS